MDEVFTGKRVMDSIISWIKQKNLRFCVGYLLTTKEFTAEIWQEYTGFENERGMLIKRKKSIGWHGIGQTMETAMQTAYAKAKDKVQ